MNFLSRYISLVVVIALILGVSEVGATTTPHSPENNPGGVPAGTPTPTTVEEPPFFGPCPTGAITLTPIDRMEVWSRLTGVNNTSWTGPGMGPNRGTLTNSGPAGYYKIYAKNAQDSYCSQLNESGYINVFNSTNPSGKPKYVNVGTEYVEADEGNRYWGCSYDRNDVSLFGWPAITDHNNIVHSERSTREDYFRANAHFYYGTFWLEPGDNNITITHACSYLLANDPSRISMGRVNAYTGVWEERHPTPAAACDGDINSLHFDRTDAICIIPE